MRYAGVVFSSRVVIGGLLEVMVTVIDFSAVIGAAGVGTFAVVSYFSPNLEFSFATSASVYAMTRSPLPPSANTSTAVVTPAYESIKFNSPTNVSNFFGTSATILIAPFLVSASMGASAIVDSIFNASASAAVILRDSSSAVSASISTTSLMIQLAAPASDSMNVKSSDTISNLLCTSAAVLSAPSLVSFVMGTSVASILFNSILSASASADCHIFRFLLRHLYFVRFLSSSLIGNKSVYRSVEMYHKTIRQ